MIEYTDAVFDETSGQWISRAEVAEIGFVAFAAQPKADQVPGRLIVRRIPDFHADKHRAAGQDGLFDVWRFHAFFTTADPHVLDTVTADKIHRGHAIIEQVHADLKNSALAHLPSGVFTANAAWLVLGGDRVQPHPRRRHPRRADRRSLGPGAGDDGDRASQADPDPLPDRDLGTTADHAPTAGLALANPWTQLITASLTHQQPRPADRPAGITGATKTTVEHHWQRGQPTRHAHHAAAAHSAVRRPHAEADRWIRAK